MANNSLTIENCLIQVRSTLQAEGIKLWLQPYYLEDIGPVDSEIESLGSRLSQTLNISHGYCVAALNELQTNAIEKLRARDLFRDSGVATLKVRIPGKTNGGRLITVQSKLDVLAENLYQEIATKLKIDAKKIKLITAGQMVDRSKILQEHGIKNNQQIMAIILEMDEEAASKDGNVFDKLQAAKNDAMTLLRKSDSYMDMEDQEGNIVHMPLEEKRAVLMALAIHEKGRVALKRKDFNEALIFLLEADNQYHACNSQMLTAVDNYALLNLDIVWCYIMLKSISHLPDAENRLRICETHFKKSYGENLDRVLTVKGNACSERAQIMRLHLLKAILNFHQNQRSQACNLLSTAELEWQQLQINENLLLTMLEMGYSDVEARIGLRSCANNIDQAIGFIHDRRDRLKKARKQGRSERITKNSLIKTTNSKWVNPRTLHTLTEMGFDVDLCALALQKTDNEINEAIALLQNQNSALREEFLQSIIPETLYQELGMMGFDVHIIGNMLKESKDINKTIDDLMKMQSDGTIASLSISNPVDSPPNPLDPSMPSTSRINENIQQRMSEEAEEEKAYERFTEDIQKDEDAYLDLPLVEERKLLDEYKKLLNI